MYTPNNQFMVDFTLPEEICEDFVNLIPYQRAVVDRYLSEGKLINYALSLENAKLWAVFNANSEMEVREMLMDFPLTRFMDMEVCMLTSFNSTEFEPSFSLN